ncbi:hypothetical protein C1645_813591 [Glomus cerebriforme]|uniref:Uncharacterized protein n=1 Tax=Glomus cerebriforme TaxID=658196 RepID=A0A397TIU5_9GLOM|nr:hypothetical protein C1645_813591 [Glomus cerebriforme]
MAISHSNLLITNGRTNNHSPYDHIIMILESEQVTLGQVAATWAWLREIINKLPTNNNRINLAKLLQIQEKAYLLFCILYLNKDNAAFVDEWLNYQNKEGPFKTESLSSSKLTKNPLRYWTSLYKYIKKTQDFLKDYELNDDTNDELGDGVNIDEMMDDLKQTSARIIDDISIFDSNNGRNLQAPTLLEIFDLQLIEASLTRGINLIL